MVLIGFLCLALSARQTKLWNPRRAKSSTSPPACSSIGSRTIFWNIGCVTTLARTTKAKWSALVVRKNTIVWRPCAATLCDNTRTLAEKRSRKRSSELSGSAVLAPSRTARPPSMCRSTN
ncbi:hypothetical protein J007_02625 [Cryptococcus neoformans]|nr:hypothetical protein J007_02625 [Cryptococcus neoformans var. grubii]OXC61894.1 hypothetical protein C358_02686 [Cryptococcus neoformans var. grubii MW-RSA852]